MAEKVAVLGAGSWGTTVASLLAAKVPTLLWARQVEVADDISSGLGNKRYLPGFDLDPGLIATADLSEAVADSDLVLVAVPTQGFRTVIESVSNVVGPGVPVVSLTKGFEKGSKLRMTEVVQSVIPEQPVGILTGPNLAKEILEGRSSVTVVAANDLGVTEVLQELLSSERFRVYTNRDLVGCEVGGAMKNVIALAAGMTEGLEVGDNARAALITRGLSEMTRLGEALGGQARTFAGLTGLGDVLVTCMSPQSRNRWVGEQIGRGRIPAEVLDSMDQVAEGVPAAGVICEIAERESVEVPIAEGVRAVVDQGRSPVEVWTDLMARRSGPEITKK